MAGPITAFRHEARFYEGPEGFLDAAVPFIEEGASRGERMMVAVAEPRLSMLRSRLAGLEASVVLKDMAEVGRNPARIIPAWKDFADAAAGDRRPMRGIGEPIWSGRSDDELIECEHHESLLNLAFDPALPFWLLCPYDTTSLSAATLATARHNHPFAHDELGAGPCRHYRHPLEGEAPFGGSLGPAGELIAEIRFGAGDLDAVRVTVAECARRLGVDPEQCFDLILAANEMATNSVRHGGGEGTMRICDDAGTLTIEVEDRGCFEDPLVGRVKPGSRKNGGRGLWMINQLADLVQIRSTPNGSIVRARLRLAPATGNGSALVRTGQTA